MTGHRPHDLLLLAAATVEMDAATTPTWVQAALRQTPWVVVRRGWAPPRHVAVGVRGRGRSQRFAWTVPHADVLAVTTPEDLARIVPAADAGPPALNALAGIRDVLQPLGLAWGPTGSVGFELATGQPTVTADSDLDLIMRVPDPTTSALLRLTQVHTAFSLLAARVDCQIELPGGFVSLTELVSGRSPIMVRAATGPALAAATELFR